jgi:hypothetical protein
MSRFIYNSTVLEYDGFCVEQTDLVACYVG